MSPTPMSLTRRKWIFSSAALAAAPQTTVAAGPKNIVISSANGLRACAKAMDVIKAGGDTLEAVVSGVTIVEDDPEDNSVGYGGLPNEEGVVELDASVTHGPSRRCGSVAGVRGIKNVARLAKTVMEETDHIMLAGEGAARFAKAYGFPEENLLTDKSRIAWLVWKKSLKDASGHNNWGEGLDAPPRKVKASFPGVDEKILAWAWEMAMYPPTGTINCLALNTKGEMSGTTTTSGLAWKIPGRIGDSPIIGAGLYVDQDVGAAGSTGRGEENIRVAGAHSIVENMRHGMDPKDAALDVLKRIARNFDNDKERLAKFDINFYALRKDGAYAGASLWSGRRRNGRIVASKFSVNEGTQSRLEDCVYLFERP